jgi:hypothetical protein
MGLRSDRLVERRKRERAAAALLYGVALGALLALGILMYASRLGPSYEDYTTNTSARTLPIVLEEEACVVEP